MSEPKPTYHTARWKRALRCLSCGATLGIVIVIDGRSYLRTAAGERIIRGEVTCPLCGCVREFNSSCHPNRNLNPF